MVASAKEEVIKKGSSVFTPKRCSANTVLQPPRFGRSLWFRFGCSEVWDACARQAGGPQSLVSRNV